MAAAGRVAKTKNIRFAKPNIFLIVFRNPTCRRHLPCFIPRAT
jgi:hypothetical protein